MFHRIGALRALMIRIDLTTPYDLMDERPGSAGPRGRFTISKTLALGLRCNRWLPAVLDDHLPVSDWEHDHGEAKMIG